MAAKQKILIVDDDNNIAELISLYLTKECFRSEEHTSELQSQQESRMPSSA